MFVITVELTIARNNHQTKISFQADGASAVEHPAHPQHQQQPVHRGRQVHQRGPQGPLCCPQKLPRGQPAVNEQFDWE